MNKHVIFIQGAGEGAYKEDALLRNSLQKELGSDYKVHYPVMPYEADAPYDLWKIKIQEEITKLRKPVILVGHSIGASHLAKILTEINITISIAGIYLLNTPFWGGKGWLYEGYKELVLPKDIASKFPKEASVFFYHTLDDEIVPFNHLALYSKLLPQANIRAIDKGGHQLSNDLAQVAKDIFNS